ncbi:MAG TPA: ATP-binding protein [Candidatus Binatia bacterium]
MPSYREPTREDLAPLLLRRFQLINTPILMGTAAFAVMHVWFREPQLALLLALKVLQATASAGGLRIATRHPSRSTIIAALVTLAVTIHLVTALTGVIIGNVHTNTVLLVATTLATASFIPWGAGAQALVVCSAMGAALLPVFGTEVYHDVWYDLVAMVVTFAISIYIASEVERDTLSEYRASAASRALAESRADFEGVFRSSNVLLALLDLTHDDFIYADVNPALANLFGWTVETMRGRTGRESGFNEEEVREWREVLSRCAEQGSIQVPEYCLRLVRPERWYHISFSAIRGEQGSAHRFCGVGVDITDRRQASEAAQRLNLDLEAQVRERTAMLEAANKDLESFAYSVSHDLRTPLRTIEGFAALLDDDHGSELSPKARAQLERIRGASRHMSRLIDDMLMLSRASRSELRREPVDVTMLVRGLVAEHRSSVPGRDVSVEVESGLFANADPQLLRIVWNNLVGNAWKYTGQRSNAHIQVGSEIHDGESAFFVRDNGCGFDMRFVGKLFQPFQRLHAAEEYEGTGVGLATVARIVRRHGGKVWAESEIDRGATFRFSLGDTAAVNAS